MMDGKVIFTENGDGTQNAATNTGNSSRMKHPMVIKYHAIKNWSEKDII